MRRLAVLALAPIVVLACARRVPPPVTAADADRVQIPLADLEAGRTLTIRKCGRCHDAPLPSDQTKAEWPAMVGEMAERSKLVGGERSAIERYLVAMTAR